MASMVMTFNATDIKEILARHVEQTVGGNVRPENVTFDISMPADPGDPRESQIGPRLTGAKVPMEAKKPAPAGGTEMEAHGVQLIKGAVEPVDIPATKIG